MSVPSVPRDPDEVAQLRAEVAALHARMDRPAARPRRFPRRFLPLALVALLVVLTPLATFAANPFTDLTGGVHDANIGLIYDAGITKGCVPDVSYCPTDTVTRQEMASFLARTAGLGTNPPVANAKTAQTAALATNAVNAQTATNATNATNAVNAQTATNATNATNATHATSADTATNATNAAQLGGYTAPNLTRIALSSDKIDAPPGSNNTIRDVTITVGGTVNQLVQIQAAFFISGFGTGCPCNYSSRIIEVGDDMQVSSTFYGQFPANGGVQQTMSYGWVFTATPGAHTYRLIGGTSSAAIFGGGTLIATTHPFGSTGGAGALEVQEPANSPAPAGPDQR